MSGAHLQNTLREMQGFFRSYRFWLLIAVVALLFTITGAMGTGATMPVLQRLSFWLALHTMAFSTAVVFAACADWLLGEIVASRLTRMLLGSAAAAAPIGFGVTLLEAGFMGGPVTLSEVGQQAAMSLPLCLLLCTLTYLTQADQSEPQSPFSDPAVPPSTASAPSPETHQTAPPPALLSRLNPQNRGALLRISAQDHYIEVITARGRELILLRLSDALKEIGGTDGIQIHRSHWVAALHIERLERQRGRLFLLTKGGSELPVSRANEAQVRQFVSNRRNPQSC
ncbi:LytTR family DNA-binding domain-containing protein [Rhizobium helianthi]|uniref:LytTR family DNA-binding domain-containing protein n=1 Tax=Rhizobium helianthi TaxID=1132695 RepID=A0ABW4M6I5_9HYPH